MPVNPMNTSDVYSKRFALRIEAMVSTRLIWCKHYFRWAGQLIAELDDPPNWILEIATITYYADAVGAINKFVYSEPFELFDSEQCADEHVACLFLLFQSGAISWATFLNDAGSFADGNDGRRECEYFYAFLNELEDNEYAHHLKNRQCTEIEAEFSEAISTIRPLYDMFMDYFRQYVAHET